MSACRQLDGRDNRRGVTRAVDFFGEAGLDVKQWAGLAKRVLPFEGCVAALLDHRPVLAGLRSARGILLAVTLVDIAHRGFEAGLAAARMEKVPEQILERLLVGLDSVGGQAGGQLIVRGQQVRHVHVVLGSELVQEVGREET